MTSPDFAIFGIVFEFPPVVERGGDFDAARLVLREAAAPLRDRVEGICTNEKKKMRCLSFSRRVVSADVLLARMLLWVSLTQFFRPILSNWLTQLIGR